ncbi:MAG: HesA/MoeB/ThiF family protein [Myxococcaceae bacterium]|jgi:adenylyltransferase/sulfurtransferase|nr:HesA/MoeB/ThiF family protein [Myxococcaceae bacterium]
MLPASVAIVGLGGLGCPASLALARLGVRALTLVDPDVVDVTNLHRQPWHHPADVGRPKVESAAEKLRRQFPDLRVEARQARVTAGSVEALFRAHDVVLDATDGVGTKFLLSDAGVITGTPVVYAGVLRFEGLAMRLEPRGPCLRCLFETPPTDVPTCAEAGVLGAMAGLVGGLQATLATRPNAQPGLGLLHVVDGRDLSFRVVKVRRRGDCVACGEGAKAVLRDEDDPSCRVPPSTSPARSAP